jgi:hypothetical protein
MQDRFTFFDFMSLLLILLLALGARAAYLHFACEDGGGKPAWRVQGEHAHLPTKPREDDRSGELAQLVENWHEQGEFKCQAPLAASEEVTAHIAPGYSWTFSQVSRLNMDDERVMRWAQAGLGTLTALFYYLFARRAFGSRRVAFVAGIAAAVYPFWILNTAELHDGVLATFALALVLVLGTRGSQSGGVLTSLLFGLALAGLVMVRATFLPFSLVALIWFVLSCRKVRMGWLCAVLAFLGYATGINPWIVRDYRVFGEPAAVVTSPFLHLWMGNCPQARGAELTEQQLKESLSAARYQELIDEKNQARRYNMLAHDVLDSVTSDPKGTCDRRVLSTLAFLLGRSWFDNDNHPLAESVNPPEELTDHQAQTVLIGTLVVVFFLSFVGWRQPSRLAALAVFWVPLPYVLSHAEMLSGPRLPLDGVLLCLAAYALVGFERKKKE